MSTELNQPSFPQPPPLSSNPGELGARIASLSPRQQAILGWIAVDASNQQIADALDASKSFPASPKRLPASSTI